MLIVHTGRYARDYAFHRFGLSTFQVPGVTEDVSELVSAVCYRYLTFCRLTRTWILLRLLPRVNDNFELVKRLAESRRTGLLGLLGYVYGAMKPKNWMVEALMREQKQKQAATYVAFQA